MLKKINSKGISLAIAIGLLLLLMVITAVISGLVMRAIKASGEVEASDKAYFAAEAGLEDGLYELSTHFSGYETPNLQTNEVRSSQFSEQVGWWSNKWELKSKGLNECLENDWENGFLPSFCGQLKQGEKLVISLYQDLATSNNVKPNRININPAEIQKLNLNTISIKFRLPQTTVINNKINEVFIDNDRDYDPEFLTGLNEDSITDPLIACDYSNGVPVADNDCDGREDEDSREDPVLIWKATDEQGNSFQPLRGCKKDPPHPTHNQVNAGLCEKNFVDEGNGELTLTLNEEDLGLVQSSNENKNNTVMSLSSFIADAGADSKLQLEILNVAPMKTINENKVTLIPYYEYGIQYEAGIDEEIPAPFFSLKSDGYFRNYKQSITTKVVPGITLRLLDLAIIQQ